MARYVVLEFDDNEKVQTLMDLIPRVDDIRIVGLFAKPTQFHDSNCPGALRKGDRSFTRGKKWGWWVCATCAKPTMLTPEKLIRNVISQGRNLLTQPQGDEADAVSYRFAPGDVASPFDPGWGALGRRWSEALEAVEQATGVTING